MMAWYWWALIALAVLMLTGWREVHRQHVTLIGDSGRPVARETTITFRHWLGFYRQTTLEGTVRKPTQEQP